MDATDMARIWAGPAAGKSEASASAATAANLAALLRMDTRTRAALRERLVLAEQGIDPNRLAYARTLIRTGRLTDRLDDAR